MKGGEYMANKTGGQALRAIRTLVKKQNTISDQLAKNMRELKDLKKKTGVLYRDVKKGRIQLKWPDPPG